MDVSQIAALATSLNDMQTRNEASTLVFKKALDNQASATYVWKARRTFP